MSVQCAKNYYQNFLLSEHTVTGQSGHNLSKHAPFNYINQQRTLRYETNCRSSLWLLEQPRSNVTSCWFLYLIIVWNIGFTFTQPISLRILYSGCIISTLTHSQSRYLLVIVITLIEVNIVCVYMCLKFLLRLYLFITCLCSVSHCGSLQCSIVFSFSNSEHTASSSQRT